jgi:hypothetical protein
MNSEASLCFSRNLIFSRKIPDKIKILHLKFVESEAWLHKKYAHKFQKIENFGSF